jgi:heme-degrading monooxygenase HmoA
VAVLYRHHVRGMDASQYDQASQQLLPALKQQPGFQYHVAFASSDGFTVSEIWETREQHDEWFENNVKPNVPAQIEVEVLDVHNVVTP